MTFDEKFISELGSETGKGFARITACRDNVRLSYQITAASRIENDTVKLCLLHLYSALRALDEANAENKAYNVCLINRKLRNMNGIEITKRIRGKYGRNVVVIVISAYEHYQVDESAKEAGANMFIPKPLFQSSLFDLFMTLTGGHVGRKELSPDTCVFRNKRILPAEDNSMNRMVAEGLIKRLDVDCECAVDGRAKLEKFTNSAPYYYDAILMDIQMPNMDSFEATVAIRSSTHANAKTVQIIALTANAFNEDIARTLSSGMNAHVAKPSESQMLAITFEKAFAVNEKNSRSVKTALTSEADKGYGNNA